MSQRRAQKNARRRRRRRSDAPPHLYVVGPSGPGPDELDGPGSIPARVRELCADPHPITLLSGVSEIISAADPRLHDHVGRPDAAEPTLGELVETFLAVDTWETDVLCRVVAHLTSDAGLARRIRRGLAGRAARGPAWLQRLDDITVTGGYLSTDPLRDADNILLEVSLPGGQLACLVTLVDHNLGGAVRDCFSIPAAASYYTDAVESSQEGHHLSVRPLATADAHAMLTPAVARSLRLWPRPESDSWPGSLALLEHLTGQLPAGGQGYPGPASEEEQEALVEEFLDSDWWHWEPDGHEADAADLLVWLHSGFLNLGPARVSPGTVDLVMTDLWERKSTDLSLRARRALPDVLRAF
uniref:hypothetical protein n=1 Tax=Ornithinicoccus halotolerans TaxID=1748220 RepID=UPI001E539564